jgi:hypothetical protein
MYPRSAIESSLLFASNIMKRLILLLSLFLSSPETRADEPLPAPAPYRTCNAAGTSCAQLRPGQDTKVYTIDPATKKETERYRIPGWHRSAFLSAEGMYFAVGYPGLNLLDLDASENTIVLTIWKQGTKHVEIRLGQVLHSLVSLRRTVSHFYWGRNLGFTKNGAFEIETIENAHIFVDPETGAIRK